MSKFTGKIYSVLLTVFSTLFLLVNAQAQTFNGPGFTVTDGGGRVATSCSIVPVSGITSDVSVSSISLNSLNHTWIGDTETRVYPPGIAPPSTAAPSVGLSSPPDARPCNFLGNYRYIDSAANSIDGATTGCVTATNVTPGDYRASTYGGGTANGTTFFITYTFGVLTPAQANGNWRVCVFDFVTPDGGSVGSTSITFSPLLAAGSSVGGRVATPDGRGIGGAKITLTDSSGEAKTAFTSPFGYFVFEDVSAGGTYVVRVDHKRYAFQNSTQIINVNDNVGDITFTSTNE